MKERDCGKAEREGKGVMGTYTIFFFDNIAEDSILKDTCCRSWKEIRVFQLLHFPRDSS